MSDDKPSIVDDLPGEAPSESPPSLRKQPLWTYFLTPVAVLIGSGIIAAAVLYINRDDQSATPAAAVVAGPVTSSAADSVQSSAPPADLLTAFLGYARQIGIDPAKMQTCLADQSRGATINRHLQRGAALNIDGTPTFVINNKKVVGAQPAGIFQEIIQAELKGSPTTLDGYSAAVKALAATTPARFEILPARVDLSEAQIEGSANAKVIIAEFSDFQCPFCKRWTDETLKTLRPTFGNDVALAFLHYPIVSIHPNAGNASLAALCASDQGKFWPMHDLLFAKQAEWQGLRAN
jgi:protein-disulfide isomerase